MREEIIRELREGEEEARCQRELLHQQELQQQREAIMAELRAEANAVEYRRRIAADQLEVKLTRTGVCYHTPKCPRLRRHNVRQLRTIVIMTKGEAVGSGYRECDQCRA